MVCSIGEDGLASLSGLHPSVRQAVGARRFSRVSTHSDAAPRARQVQIHLGRDDLSRRVSRAMSDGPRVLVFPEYKLAPESKWPQQQEQCFDILEWVTKNGKSHNVIPNNFAIVADSAAGKLNPLS